MLRFHVTSLNMKFLLSAITLAHCVFRASAKGDINVPEVISDFYGSSAPVLNEDQSTSLASALYAVSTSFSDSPNYLSAFAGILYAAPSPLQTSWIQGSSSVFTGDLTTETWFENAPKPAQTAWASYSSDLNKAATSAIGTLAPTKTSKGAAPRMTGMGVAGVMGVVGGVLAAL